MRRRTKPRVVWLPPTNANSLGDGSQGYQGFVLSPTGSTGNTAVADIPMVIDSQLSVNDPETHSLADIESSGYRLRRIVGKIWVQVGVSSFGTDAPFSAIVTAGFMVRRALTSTGQSLAALAEPTGLTDVSPAEIDNWGDPWIWRRSWIVYNPLVASNLTNNPTTGEDIPLNPNVPTSNMEYGSVADGPHVDQKTARLVGPEERLFLDVSASILNQPNNPASTSPISIGVFTDIRVLGSLRTSAGNRRNANR